MLSADPEPSARRARLAWDSSPASVNPTRPAQPPVSVAIPVLDGAGTLGQVLAAVRAQELDAELELVIIDSGSTDGSPEIAHAAGATVQQIALTDFSHGATRNRLMAMSGGDHVAFLTQDAVPASSRWLAELLAGFARAPDVALSFGPYLPRPGASPMVRRELEDWFARMAPLHRAASPTPGPAGFFSDVNGCVARWAWEQVPFRAVPYAEDRVLAADVLSRGWAVAYCGGAGVLHSHDYGPLALLRRAFDEGRALRELYGHRAPLHPGTLVRLARGEVTADRAYAESTPAVRSALHHSLRLLGAGLGGRADVLPTVLRRALSLEGRGEFRPLDLESPARGVPAS